jgi:hypothetical protein
MRDRLAQALNVRFGSLATRILASQRTREELTALIEGRPFHNIGKRGAGQ